jgi:ribosome-associated protein
MKEIKISKEPIELNKLLKFENLVASGGEAKVVIREGLVSLNGSVASQLRKKVVAGDKIQFQGQEFTVKLADS